MTTYTRVRHRQQSFTLGESSPFLNLANSEDDAQSRASHNVRARFQIRTDLRLLATLNFRSGRMQCRRHTDYRVDRSVDGA